MTDYFPGSDMMSRKKYEIDMTQGSVLKNTIMFALPMIAGNLLQLMYNAADMIVVSRWAGSNAMASVGATGSLSSLIVTLCMGLSIGASVVVSRNFGAGDKDGLHRAVHTSMLVGLISGLIAMVVGISLARPLLILMGTPSGEVLEGAVLYMRLYFAGIPGTMVYNFGSAILRSIGDTKRPLYILSATGVVNVVLNLVFVINFHMGVAGVAIATMIANYISAVAVVHMLVKADGAYRLRLSALRIYSKEFREILCIGLPSALQSSMFHIANIVIQSTVNSFGAAAIAGCSAGANIEGFVYTAMHAFYTATLTGVSQNYGAKNEKRIYRTIITSVCCVAAVGVCLGAVMVVFSRPLLGIYITDSAEAIEYGAMRLMISGLPYFLSGVMDVLTGSLRGIGYSGVAATNSLIGVCGVRLVWVWLILPLHRTIGVLFLCWPVSWIIAITMHTITFLAVRKKTMSKMREG